MKVLSLLLFVYAAANAQQSPCQQQGFELGADGYCYKIVQDKLDFYPAAKQCAAMNSRLPVVQNSFQNAVIMGIIEKDLPIWLGFTKYNIAGQPQDNWRWDNPITNYSKMPDFTKPCHEFDCEPHDGRIAILLPYGAWTDSDADSSGMTKFLCQMPNNNAGPCYYKVTSVAAYYQNPSNKKCYSISDNQQKNQAQGATQCAAENGHLPTIQSQQENEFLLSQFCWECNLNSTAQAWTGLMLNNGKYTWKAASSSGNCVVMNFPSGQWSYADCINTKANTFCMRNSATN